MRTELANLNHCAVPFLSRAAVNLCWYYYNIFEDKEQALHFSQEFTAYDVKNKESAERLEADMAYNSPVGGL